MSKSLLEKAKKRVKAGPKPREEEGKKEAGGKKTVKFSEYITGIKTLKDAKSLIGRMAKSIPGEKLEKMVQDLVPDDAEENKEEQDGQEEEMSPEQVAEALKKQTDEIMESWGGLKG